MAVQAPASALDTAPPTAVTVDNLNEVINKYPEYSERFFATLPILGKKTVMEWCIKEGLLGSSYECPKCKKSMKLQERKDINDGYVWSCRNQSRVQDKRHDATRSIRKGSWFELSHLDLCTIMLIVRKWFGKCSVKYVVEDLKVTNKPVIDWYSFCREVCVEVMVRDSCKIGGVDKVVEIDENKFGKKKYGQGRPMKGRWVYGGIERGTNRCFFRIVNGRTKACLLDVITEWVEPGTTIISDCWRSYQCLEDEAFERLKVERNLTYVCPSTGEHINTIIGVWSGIKQFMKKSAHRSGEMFDSYLYEFMWRKKHNNSLKSEVFKSFLGDIVRIYPPTMKDLPVEEKLHQEDDDSSDVDSPSPSSIL